MAGAFKHRPSAYLDRSPPANPVRADRPAAPASDRPARSDGV